MRHGAVGELTWNSKCERTAPEVPQQASKGVPSTFRQLSVVPAVGTVVQFKECKLKPELNWCFGVVGTKAEC